GVPEWAPLLLYVGVPRGAGAAWRRPNTQQTTTKNRRGAAMLRLQYIVVPGNCLATLRAFLTNLLVVSG
ncbi:MAG: hypothetical protein ACM3ZQ_01415, partial [Bacillota bacterium]